MILLYLCWYDRHIKEANEESKRQLSYAEDRLEDLKIGLRKKSADVLRDRLLLNSALDDLESDSVSSTPPVSWQTWQYMKSIERCRWSQ